MSNNLLKLSGLAIVSFMSYDLDIVSLSNANINNAIIKMQNSYQNNIESSYSDKLFNNYSILEKEKIAILFNIESNLNIKIDNTFIPNIKEKQLALFITCKEFRELCNKYDFDKAIELENKIYKNVKNLLESNSKIKSISFI